MSSGDKDKIVVGLAAFVAVVAGLFPPWGFYRSNGPAGYHFLFLPPANAIHIDVTRLVLEWILIGGIAAAVRYLWAR
jgi:hypothetical protein